MIERDQVNVCDPEIETVVNSLVNYLKADDRLGQFIDQFYNEWPDANQGEFENTLSVHTTSAKYSDCMTVVDKFEPILNEAIDQAVTYRTGKYDISIQADIWSPYKAKRNELYKRFCDIINEDLLTKDQRASGLSLVLDNYFGTIARYDIIGYNFPDTERSSQEDDWRATINLQVHFDKKMQKVVPKIIETIIVASDTPNDDSDISETIVIE